MPKADAAVTRRRVLWWNGIAILVFILDQTSKFWAVQTLDKQHAISVFPGFNLRLAFNKGAAFSFLADGSGWQRGFLIGFALTMMGLLLCWLRAVVKRQASAMGVVVGLALLFGGAAGNLVDRLETGRVVDFIQWYYQDWYWPTFNVADMAICIGIALLAVDAGKRDAQD